MKFPQNSLLRLLQKLVGQADVASPSAQQCYSASRRTFIRQVSVATAGATLPNGWIYTRQQKPTIAIIGAGMSGLTAAYHLEKAGLQATLFEAANRVGGRVHSAKNLLADGIITELGAEFIDSNHTDILRFCRLFGLPLLDTGTTAEQKLTGTAYFFNGQALSEVEVIQAFVPFASLIRQDIASLNRLPYAKNPALKKLDYLSIDAYLELIGLSGWLHELISTSFTSEYGLSAGDQSSLNMLTLLNPDTANGFSLYGDSDERYKVMGGNDRIATEVYKRLTSPVQTGCALERIAEKGRGYQLSFANGHQTYADFVICTVPFSVLRTVQLDLPLSYRKRRCIQGLGYGTHSKLFIGVSSRVWRQAGYGGNAFSGSIQNGWDSSRMQGNNTGPGSYSLLLGGESGRTLTINQFDGYVDGCEQIFPGMKQATNDQKNLYNWTNNPLTKGSYSCYRVGQITAFGGAEGERAGNLFFAGEHCSQQFQGFMNGAAETGRKAAEALTNHFFGHARLHQSTSNR